MKQSVRRTGEHGPAWAGIGLAWTGAGNVACAALLSPELNRPNASELTLCSRCLVGNTPFICDSLPDAPALEDRNENP